MSKLTDTIDEQVRWNDRAGLKDVNDLNRAIKEGRIGDIIRTSEALQEKKLAAIAEKIANDPNIKVILLAGPPLPSVFPSS